MRPSTFYIETGRDKRTWLACTLAFVAMACAAWALLDSQPPRTGVVLQQRTAAAASFQGPSPFDAVSASPGPAAALPAAAAVPQAPARPQAVAAATTPAANTEDPQELASFRDMDAKLRPGAPVPDWAPMDALAAEVSRAESNTTLARVACADEFCRLDLKTASGMEQGALVETLITPLAARGSALMFR